ncbi:TRAP transporter small permease [Paracoccus sanguinis]|uniref:TRAP transporter small permease n=1 Tax=Paracoccus sanguinis TaxID=1545044 RepID=UPI00051FDB91|nr:TRAP transporter small permease [Paracoccus sanguinis]KGJ15115.1 hypothetical protein IX54_03295 [Paracoccus sanguinis]
MKAIERIMLELAVVSVFLLTALIATDVAMRTFAHRTLPDVVILVRELMIPTIMLPLAAATAHRAHISVTFLTDRMSPAWRGRLIVMGWVVALIAVLPLIYASARDFNATWTSGEFYDGQLGVPRWPMRLVFLLGLIAMWVRLAQVALADLTELRRTGTVTEQRHDEEEAV